MQNVKNIFPNFCFRCTYIGRCIISTPVKTTSILLISVMKCYMLSKSILDLENQENQSRNLSICGNMCLLLPINLESLTVTTNFNAQNYFLKWFSRATDFLLTTLCNWQEVLVLLNVRSIRKLELNHKLSCDSIST